MARRVSRRRRDFGRRVDGFLKGTNRSERSTLRGANAIIRDIQLVLIDRLASAAGWTFDNLNELRAAVEDSIGSLDARLNEFLQGEALGFWEQGIQTTVEPVAEFFNVHVGTGNIDTRMLQVLDINRADLVTQILEKTKQRIHNEVNLAVTGVQRPQEALRAIRGLISSDPKRRGKEGLTAAAEKIVRTEMNRAHSIASFEAMKQVQEIVPGAMKEWVTQLDGRQRHSHNELDGMKVPVDEPFKHSSIKTPGGLMFPRDPRGLPADVINCRCRLVLSQDILEKEFDTE